MKVRSIHSIKKIGKIILIVIFCIIAYEIGFNIPCPFKLLTGLDCPSCGITRMGISMMHGNFHRAFMYNQVLFVLTPFLSIYAIFFTYRYITKGISTIGKYEKIVLTIVSIILVLYGIVRNLPNYPYSIL